MFSALLASFTLFVIASTKPFAFVTPVGVEGSTFQFPPFSSRTRTMLFVVVSVSALLWNRNSTRFASCGTVISICLLPAIVAEGEYSPILTTFSSLLVETSVSPTLLTTVIAVG